MRLSLRLRNILECEAAVEDVRVGTVVNRLLQEEIDKMILVGADRCLMFGTREYRAAESDVKEYPALYYILPSEQTIQKYIGTRLDDSKYPQMSLYFTEEQHELLQALVKKQRIPTTVQNGMVKSFRYVIVGMLLNNRLFDRLEK